MCGLKRHRFGKPENTRLFEHEWQQAIFGGFQYAQLITWNDFSETTEVSPGIETQFLFYDLTRYYSAWFKSGKRPEIYKDAIYYCHRNQIIEPDYSPVQGEAPMHLHGVLVSNKVEMLAFLIAPATLQIELGRHRKNNDRHGWFGQVYE